MSDMTGQTLGQYHLVEQIGKGGMATVYRATQASIGREVAVKVLYKSLIEQDATFLDRFYQEVQIVAHLQHPHILPVYDFGEQGGQPYIVMAFLSGGALADHIRQQGQLRLPETVRLVRQMADALDFAHSRGIVHRDFKPGNVLLDEPGNAYLADFGLAKVVQESPHLTASGIVGTPDYMAPDWSRESSVTPSVDIYALGVALYQMLTGEVPYRASTPMGVLMAHMNEPIPNVCARRPDLPDGVQAVVAAALAKTPTERFATVTDLADAFDKAAAGVEVSPVTLPQVKDTAPTIAAAHARGHFLSAAEVLGQEEFHIVLLWAGLGHLVGNYPPADAHMTFPADQFSRFWQAIYQVYGIRGLKAVAKKVGMRAWHSMKSWSSPTDKIAAQVASAVVKTGSLETKLRNTFEFLARYLNTVGNQRQEIEFEEAPDHLL